MTYLFRPGHYNVTDAETAQVYEPGGALPWWNPDGATPAATCGAWQAKGAASLAASYLNLATLGNANIDPAVVGGVAPGFGANGWIADGVSTYLISGIVPAAGYSMIAQFADGIADGGIHTLCGLFQIERFYIRPISAANRIYGYGNAANVKVGQQVAGNMAIAATNCYLNGIADGVAGAWVNTIMSIWILGENATGRYWNGTLQAIAIYNVTLTAAQVLARATAMAAL